MFVRSFAIGQRVRIKIVPPLVAQHCPPETSELFARCVGQVLRVEDVDREGCLELNVLDDGSQAPNYCFHTIYVEPEFVEPVEP